MISVILTDENIHHTIMKIKYSNNSKEMKTEKILSSKKYNK